MDGSSFCKSGVRLMLCFSKYSCTLAFALRVAIESVATAQLICANQLCRIPKKDKNCAKPPE